MACQNKETNFDIANKIVGIDSFQLGFIDPFFIDVLATVLMELHLHDVSRTDY